MLRPLLSVLLAILLPSAAFSATEIGQVIRKALVEQVHGTLPWAFYAQPNSPIEWQSEGTRGYKREGTAVLAVAGFVPEVLGKFVEPGKWSILVYGDKFGIHAMRLTTDACFGSNTVSDNCFAQISQFLKSLKLAEVESETICQFGPGSARSQVQRIRVPGGESSFLHSVVNIGSGGQTLELNLIFRSQAKGTDLEHGTAVCSILFESKYGIDSFVGSDYLRLLSP